MFDEIFEELGFTHAEAKIYLALLKIGETTSGQIIKESKLQNSTTHKILNKLISKGIVSFITKGKTKHYKATEPENFLKILKEKEKKLEEIIPKLKSLQIPTNKENAEIFEGFEGFKNMLREIIKESKKGEEYLFFSFFTENPEDFEYVYNFYKEFEKERKEKGIIVKGIAPKQIKNMFKGRNKKNLFFADFPTPLNITIFRDKIAFTPWENRKISFLITSQQLAEEFRTYFYSIWKKK